MQPSDSLPPVGRGSGRPWPVAYPVPRATRRKKGLPGTWAVLFQRAVGSDPAGCASRLAHRVETAIAFRLHNALGTQNERYFVAVNPTAHSLACLRIGVFVTADAARLATGVGGLPFTGRVSHPLDGKQSFMTSPHRHSPLTSLAWSHHAPTPLIPQALLPLTESLESTTRSLGEQVFIERATQAFAERGDIASAIGNLLLAEDFDAEPSSLGDFAALLAAARTGTVEDLPDLEPQLSALVAPAPAADRRPARPR